MKILNLIHYQAMRTILSNHFNKLSRGEVDEKSRHSMTRQWANYCNAKMAIVLTYRGANGLPMSDKLIKKRCINDRRPGIGTIPETSRLKIGRHSFTNRLEMLKKVKFNWTNGISPQLLHVNLKKTFLPISVTKK